MLVKCCRSKKYLSPKAIVLYYHLIEIMEENSNLNQRRFPRSFLRKEVAFNEGDFDPSQGAYGCDLSLGGVCLEVNRFIPLGKLLTISLRVHEDKVVQAIAKVVWVTERPMSERFRIGLQFEKFVQGNAEHINEYLYLKK